MGTLKRNDVQQINTPLGDIIRLGDWYWYTPEREGAEADIWCVTALGSNYVELDSPAHASYRIHLDEFHLKTKPEPDADRILESRAAACVAEIRRATLAIRGLDTRLCLGGGGGGEAPESTALSLISGDDKAKQYEDRLVEARDVIIPREQECIKVATRELNVWVKARTYGIRSEADQIERVMEKIEGRLLDLSIYTGLSEHVETVIKGQHTPGAEPIHIMQRLLYMDEECLLRYEAGGMEFRDILDFDAWLTRPENLDRLLPFARCVVGFQVRRNTKDRESSTISSYFINLALEQRDRYTYLYIRNGGALYRIVSEHEFGERLFPDDEDLSFVEPMVGYFDRDDFKGFATAREEEAERLAREEKERQDAIKKQLHRVWCRKYKPNFHRLKQKGKHLDHCWDRKSPFYVRDDSWSYERRRVEPFDTSSVYYDDMVAAIDREIQDYNRLSLLLQGLLDRSSVFLPHPDIRMWNTESAQKYVQLVFDGSRVLHNGEAPDFEEYREEVNRTLKPGSLVIGQRAIWNKLQHAEMQSRSKYDRSVGKYSGNGPPLFARIVRIRDGRATFEWKAESMHYWGRIVSRSMRVPLKELFNVEAYQKGDYLRFYQDPRTRQFYLKWAPTLLYCEEYVSNTIDESGKRKNPKNDERYYDEDY